MKRKRSLRNIEPELKEAILPMDMLREIASHTDLITSRLMYGLCRSTRSGIPRREFNLEAWTKAIPEAHDSILRQAQYYILEVIEGPIKTDFWGWVLKYWTNQERFVKDQGALNVIHFAQTHFLSPGDDQWALDYLWVTDDPCFLAEHTTYAILWRSDVCKEDNTFLKLIKHFIRRAFPKIWKSPFKDEIYKGIAWACAAKDYWIHMWE